MMCWNFSVKNEYTYLKPNSNQTQQSKLNLNERWIWFILSFTWINECVFSIYPLYINNAWIKSIELLCARIHRQVHGQTEWRNSNTSYLQFTEYIIALFCHLYWFSTENVLFCFSNPTLITFDLTYIIFPYILNAESYIPQ